MKLLLQALLLTSVSVSITSASGYILHTPRGQPTSYVVPMAPIKKAKAPQMKISEQPGVNRNLLAELNAAAEAPERDAESDAVSDSDSE